MRTIWLSQGLRRARSSITRDQGRHPLRRLRGPTRRGDAPFSRLSIDALSGSLSEASAAVAEAIDAQQEFFLVRARMYARHPGLRATRLHINDDWIDQ